MRIIPEKRARLSRLIIDARKKAGVDQMGLANLATLVLESLSPSDDQFLTSEEIELAQKVEVTRHHIFRLENCPVAPLGTVEKRFRLWSVCKVLHLDLPMVNRLAGAL